MILKKAVEVLVQDIAHPGQGDYKELVKAQTLGAEALKRLINYRRDKCHTANARLPSETEE